MRATTRHSDNMDRSADLLRDILILQLSLAGIPQHTIRQIVGVKLNRVTRIARHLHPRLLSKKNAQQPAKK